MKYQTKKETIALMYEILNPLKPLYSEGGARLNIEKFGASYDKQSIELEGFSRPLWALIPFWAGGSSDTEFEEIYIKGLTNGTNPEHQEFWGIGEDFDQRFVEMAAISAGIIDAPEKLWKPLSENAKQNLARWLNEANKHDLPKSNWRCFRVLVNLALNSVDMPCDLELMELDLKLIDSFYEGDGWYSDGNNSHKDYYNSWVIQYCSVFYAHHAKKRDPERAWRYKERACIFAKQFIYWFDENGSAIPFGRSLTYRFAQSAFWSICVATELEVLPLGVLKGLINRNLTWWMEQEIFDRNGILNVGYCYPQMYMAECYNAPGGPYWGMNAFTHLSLPEDHKFWKIKEEPIPDIYGITPFYHADMIMQRLHDGQVNAYVSGVNNTNGCGQYIEKYAKFVYNTRFGISVSRGMNFIEEAAPDCMLAFEIEGNIYVRKTSLEFKMYEDSIWSKWSPTPGITVETTIYPREIDHLRRHVIKSDRKCKIYDCGFAVENYAQAFWQEADVGGATVQNKDVGCAVLGHGQGVNIKAFPNTNYYHTNTIIPAISYDIKKGETVIETIVEAWCM